MSDNQSFPGFPSVGKGTVVPNLFFSVVMPRLSSAADVLAFLWASKACQEQRAEVRFVTAPDLWDDEGCRAAFVAMASGREEMERGLAACASAGALLAIELLGPDGVELAYFVNNPGSRRAVARARAGELELRPRTTVRAIAIEARPGIFRLYEENIGTITPLVAERLLASAEEYPWEWIEDAFREAVELNRRSWRYVERILQRWTEEGRNETVGRDSYDPAPRNGGPAPTYVARRR